MIYRIFPQILLYLFVFFAASSAQDTTSPSVKAFRIPDSVKISIDGKIDEPVWSHMEKITRFIQREPDEGDIANNPVALSFGYTESHLYVAAEVIKGDDEIQAIVSRRDRSANSERLIVTIDTYYDKRTSYSFGVTATGVRLDYYHPRDNPWNRDQSYNPVWIARTDIKENSWTAEMKIPFSQLRFEPDSNLTFGLNVNHYVPNKNEDTYWVLIPRNEAGWASRFGDLTNISNVDSPTKFELLPYVAGNSTIFGSPNPDNPFSERVDMNARLGGDIKYRLSSNLILDATINPDFGQVDADPAVVNLSAFEVFQPEQRPFFTEGSSLFSGGGARYFYSRRIGGIPTYRPSISDGFIDVANNTTILGAAKITGFLDGGLAIGGISALTSREFVQIYDASSDEFSRVKSEPLTAYNVVRAQKQFGEWGSTAGFIFTSVNREYRSGDPLDLILPHQSYSGASDWNLRFDKGNYELSFNTGFSHVQGHRDAILKLQQRSSRFFQRPDVSYVSVDSTRTTLTGFRSGFEFSKLGGEHWLWSVGGSTESPEFEINDMGILNTADDINGFAELQYRDNQPSSWYFKYNMGIWTSSLWNYDLVRNQSSLGYWGNLTFNDFSRVNLNLDYDIPGLSDNLTRGGPYMTNEARWRIRSSYSSNTQLSNFWRAGFSYFEDNYDGSGGSMWFRLGGLLGNRWEYSIQPNWNRSTGGIQYFDNTDRPIGDNRTYGMRYQFSSIDFTTISTTFRLNMAFTPDLSLDLYAEPFVSSGNFYDVGELTEAGTNNIDQYEIIERTDDGDYLVSDGMSQFEISDRDFKVFSFRSNIVLRYEWIPGSTLFVVWQQNRVNRLDQYSIATPIDLYSSLNQTGNQFFAFKVSYWFPA